MIPKSEMLRITVYVGKREYIAIRQDLISRRISFSEWVRQRMQEQLFQSEVSV